MGNVHTDVTNNVKAQAYGTHDSETYKLLDVNGGGELIELMKDPLLNKNSSRLDSAIRKKVINCMYNDGLGADVCQFNNFTKIFINISIFFEDSIFEIGSLPNKK